MRLIDVFKVGVSIAMHSNSAQVLSAMLAQLTGIHVAAGHVQGSLNKVRQVALGAGAVFAGWEIIKGLISATKHAEKLNHELVKLQTGARLTDAQTGAASNLAFNVSRTVKGTDVADNVKMQRELFGVFGNMDTAQQLLPMVAQGSRAVGNFVDKDTDLAQIAIRALEMRGHITKDHKVDPKEFANEFNAMVRSIVASEGLVDPQKLFMFIKQAGPAARTMSAETMWGEMPAIMNAMGSGPAGTALNSFFAQMIGHVVAGKRVAVAMEDAGMLTHGKWQVERGGKVRMDRDAVPDQEGVMKNPIEWLHTKLEALREKKDEKGNPIDLLGVIQRIFQFSSRSTSARFINDVDANYAIIENEKKRFQRTPNPDVIAKEQNEKDLSVNIHNLNEAWTNFMAALGGPGIPVAIKVLQTLTDALNVLQAAIIGNSPIVTGVFYLAGGIAALTALGGSLAILNVCWTPLVVGLRLLTGVTGLAATGAGLGSVATGLSVLARIVTGPVGAAMLALSVMKPSATNVGEEKTPGYADRFGDKDPNIGRTSYVAPPASGQKVELKGDINMDGKKVGTIVANGIADRMSRPSTGTNGADLRVSPWMPGLAAGAH